MPYRAKINGIEIQHKKRVALEIIKQYIDNNINTLSILQLKEQLNDKHFSGVDVIMDDNDKINFINRRSEQEFLTRYFINNDEVLKINGENIYVTTQWGIRSEEPHRYFSGFIEFAKNNLDINIEIINADVSQNNYNGSETLVSPELGTTKVVHPINIKNIILYGAPGVGKTHNYQRLISMIENKDSKKDIFNKITDNKSNEKIELNEKDFQTIKDEKRVEFITFHQSYSYEDFIEGFRPQENGNIELEDGIFKLICNKAKNQIKETKLQHISFDEAFDIFRTQYVENEIDKIYSVSNVEILIHQFKEKTIKVQSSQAKDHQYVKKSDLETVVQGIVNDTINKPSDIKNLDVKKDTISLGGLYYPIGKRIVEIINNNKKTIEEKEKNFYIVIDEINRGNISKIFGELITLIEEDKRDIYEVTLPYSKEKFKVPSNLYIIATMNSTDKSIATIDIALRRRFTFLKMKPNLDLVNYPDAKELMKKLNIYISDNLGEDYQLGHSYFMKVQNDEDLEFVTEYKIKPLLEEYFYADEKSADDILNEVLKSE